MSSSSFLLPISLLLLLLPTSLSQTCNSPKFTTPNKSFTSCTSLPHLNATLHYTFNTTTSTLSIAFTAPPPSSSGWVAWAINPTATGMAGSQALLAFKSSNGSLSISTYNIKSKALPSPGPLSYNVSALAGEVSGDKFTVFGTWQLPAMTESINQVWQVGPSVTNGVPAIHAFDPDNNLAAVGKLDLTGAAVVVPTSVSPAEAPAGGKNGAGSVSVSVSVGVVWLAFVVGAFGFLF